MIQFSIEILMPILTIIFGLIGVVWWMLNNRIKNIEDKVEKVETKNEEKLNKIEEQNRQDVKELLNKMEKVVEIVSDFKCSVAKNDSIYMLRSDCEKCRNLK